MFTIISNGVMAPVNEFLILNSELSPVNEQNAVSLIL